MNSVPMFNDEYLTDVEDDSEDDSEYTNFYNFISTQARTNTELANYLFVIGWIEKVDTYLLDTMDIQQIYQSGSDIILELTDYTKLIVINQNIHVFMDRFV